MLPGEGDCDGEDRLTEGLRQSVPPLLAASRSLRRRNRCVATVTRGSIASQTTPLSGSGLVLRTRAASARYADKRWANPTSNESGVMASWPPERSKKILRKLPPNWIRRHAATNSRKDKMPSSFESSSAQARSNFTNFLSKPALNDFASDGGNAAFAAGRSIMLCTSPIVSTRSRTPMANAGPTEELLVGERVNRRVMLGLPAACRRFSASAVKAASKR
mmetsp:Transcript_44016/g.127078  ORF Transcript_44016/g.127078 Transcript_44016/m.127078 type:complete len:219 (-) Transcript_44016:781-1437(-)